MSKGEGRSCKKCLAFVAVFIVFQAAIILALALTVMKVKSPKLGFNAMVVETFTFVETFTNGTTTSIKMKLLAQLTIKNTNFGHFKYDESTLVILHKGVPLGEQVIPPGRTKAKKTQKLEISVDVNTDRGPGSELRNEINSGNLKLRSQAKLNGKVHLMKIIKKKKSGEMKCDWDLNLGTKEIENLKC
ncbi:late embryogenesis abundant protein At1g64065-like [Salvia hispanica]|uniref:late embryogenesis abundant protein At1g64065-like n=1 Tax=Salvia hispanica TaxID=49212 RepID=UPI002009B986|nr:late embryogenesis abundant protein At1g64065-like [Salvia hispanica]